MGAAALYNLVLWFCTSIVGFHSICVGRIWDLADVRHVPVGNCCSHHAPDLQGANQEPLALHI